MTSPHVHDCSSQGRCQYQCTHLRVQSQDSSLLRVCFCPQISTPEQRESEMLVQQSTREVVCSCKVTAEEGQWSPPLWYSVQWKTFRLCRETHVQLERGRSNGLSVFFRLRLVAPFYYLLYNDWVTSPLLHRKSLLSVVKLLSTFNFLL